MHDGGKRAPLVSGFAWRLLHLPPKEEKAFKLYKHSRTLPSLMTKEDKENTSLEEDKDVVPSKRIHKTYTQPLNEPKTERSKVYSSPKESYTLKDSKLSKNIPENIIENPPRKDFETVCEKPEPIVEEKVEAPPAPVEPISAEEENTAFKKKKSKKEDSDKSYKRSLSHSKSVTEEKPAEIIETPKEIVEPADEPVINETVTEPPVEEIIEETALETPNEPEIISPSTKEEPEEIKEKETEIIEEKEIEKIEEKEIEVVEDATAPASQIEPEEIKPSEIELVEAPVESEQETVEPEKEPVLEVEPMESLEPSHSDSTPIVEEIDQVNEPDVESNQISTEASEEKEVIDEPVKSVSENTEVTENKQEEVDGVVICNGTESYTETRFGEDDDGELVITEVREETSDTTVEASSGQITHTVYSTTTETVIEAVDTTTQISEVPEDSEKPEEHINETDITTDDENVEVLSE